MSEQRLHNWGGYPTMTATLHAPARPEGVRLAPGQPVIARGNGRCYGDSALQATVVSTLRWNKILAFDREQGVCCCEAGVLLGDLLAVIVPQGFFLPVTPGTKLVTVGGAVAANVHGKNHHQAGALARYVDALELLSADGTRRWCSRTAHADLFRDTLGGMGLTGIITAVRLRLRRIESAYLSVAQHRAGSLAEVLALLAAGGTHEYTVAWLDVLTSGRALGRGVVQAGGHAPLAGLGTSERADPLRVHGGPALSLPFYLPRRTLNRASIGLYNALYYHGHPTRPARLVHYNDFFYPLDQLRHWNRLYGRPGFVQYQLVLPPATAEAGLLEILRTVQRAGCPAFLAVLKLLGEAEEGVSALSFPRAGYSLALDFPLTPTVLVLLGRLDELVLQHGGRLYLAKDARMPAEVFHQTYPPFAHPAAFQSLQAQRLRI